MTTLRERWGDKKYDVVMARKAERERQKEIWDLTLDADKLAQGYAMIDTLEKRISEIEAQFPSMPDMPHATWVFCHNSAQAASYIKYLIHKKNLDQLFNAIYAAFNRLEMSVEFLEKENE